MDGPMPDPSTLSDDEGQEEVWIPLFGFFLEATNVMLSLGC